MATGLADAIRAVVQDKGISEELILDVIEEFLLAAYKRRFGAADNAVVQFTDDGNEVTLYAQKQIVEDVEDPVTQIALSEALELNEECEVGDELLIEINPQEFDRVAIQRAKQRARERIREIQKDSLYSEYHGKVGELVVGYVQRERNGNIFVDLGKAEGILPKRYQSPREVYRPNDRIKALIVDVEKSGPTLQIVLSRTHTELVKRIFEIEVPEIYNKTVEISKIVREAGYRTKLAVRSHREDVDPVGACVGLRGVRIQAIVRELEGEKIDILKYDPDPRMFIKNALSPAEVGNVVVVDEAKRQALAIVPESQLSLAIGKQGLNVRLANRLADWNIDVKTEQQFGEMDIAVESKRVVSALFGESAPTSEEDEITRVAELPGITDKLVKVLTANDVDLIEDLVALSESEIDNLEGMTPAYASELNKILAESVEIVEEEEESTEESDSEEYEESDEAQEAAPVESEESATEAPQTEAAEVEAAEPEADEIEPDETEQAAPADEVSLPEDEESEEELVTSISELPGMTDDLVSALEAAGVTDLNDLIVLEHSEIDKLPGLTDEQTESIKTILTESIEIVEEESEEDEPEEE